MFFSIHQNSVNPRWVLLTLLNFKLLTINYRICISFRPEPGKNLTYVQQIKKKTLQGEQLSHGSTQTTCLLVTPTTELTWESPFPVPDQYQYHWQHWHREWTFTLGLLCFSKYHDFLGLWLSETISSTQIRDVPSGFWQTQPETDLRHKTEEHKVSLYRDKLTISYENNYSPAQRGWHKAALGFGYCLGVREYGQFYLNIT